MTRRPGARRRSASLSTCAALLLAACAAPIVDVRRVEFPPALAWLRAGETTRAELEQHLGRAQRVLEGGRIHCWRLDERFELRPEPGFEESDAPPYSLVIVLGEGERAERVSLVKLW